MEDISNTQEQISSSKDTVSNIMWVFRLKYALITIQKPKKSYTYTIVLSYTVLLYLLIIHSNRNIICMGISGERSDIVFLRLYDIRMFFTFD